jgi:two-component system, NarL family, sensor kinase
MKHAVLLSACWLFCRVVLLGQASPDSISLLDAQLSDLAKARRYSEAAFLCNTLSKSFHKIFGFNKHSFEYLLKSMNYHGLAGDSLYYYRAHVFIADYYEQDLLLSKTNTISFYQKALGYFTRVDNLEEIITCRNALLSYKIKNADNNPSQKLEKEFDDLETVSKVYGLERRLYRTYNYRANYYLKIRQFDKAIAYINKSIALNSPQQGEEWLEMLNQYYFGLAFKYKGEHRKALSYFFKAEQLATDQKLYFSLRDISNHIAETNSWLGRPEKAYEYSRKAFLLAEQIVRSEHAKNILLMESDEQIARLKLENALMDHQRGEQRNLSFLLAAGLLLALLSVFILFILRRQQLLRAKNKEALDRQKIKELEIQAMRQLIEGQERERGRIAKDLHDSIGAHLSQLKLYVESNSATRNTDLVHHVAASIDELCMEVREIANDLSPVILNTLGLTAALQTLAHVQTSDEHLPSITLHTAGQEPALSNEQKINLFRIMQELLSNAIRHSGALHITLQALYRQDTVLLSVEDDGKGFDTATGSGGHGIANINSRVEYLGGQILWHSAPGKGASAMITIPLKNAGQAVAH